MIYTTASYKYLIYREYNDYDIYKLYIPNIRIGCNINSPLRRNDNNPSFSIYINKNNTLCWYDHGLGIGGNIFEYIKRKFNLNYFETVKKVYEDLKGFTSYNKEIDYTKVTEKTRIFHSSREIEDRDKDYWKQYLNNLNTLNKIKVIPIDYYHIGNKGEYRASKHTYLFPIGSRRKIYRPFSEPKYFGNTNASSIDGWNMLNFNNKDLWIVSSRKERLVLYELGIQTIAPNSETTLIPVWLMNILKNYFNLNILYDWDTTGINNAKKQSIIYNINIHPLQYHRSDTKDLSDFRKKYGYYYTKELIYNYEN